LIRIILRLYTSAVYLYLRSILTAAVPGFVFSAFPCSSLFIPPLVYQIREIWLDDTNKYSNISRRCSTLIGNVVYTSAVYLYLRSILTAGVPGFVFSAFPCSSLFIPPLVYQLREIWLDDTNKYSNISRRCSFYFI